MTDTDANPELTARVKALSFTACGLVAAAEQFATIALHVAGGLDGLHTDLQGLPPNLAEDNREPGFYRIAVGTAALLDPTERGEQHVRMAAMAAGFGEPEDADIPMAAAEQAPRIIADLLALATRHDLNIGTIIEAALTASSRS
jgi:hypothetical protein